MPPKVQKNDRCSPRSRMQSRKTLCETSYLYIFSPVAVPMHYGLWNAEEGGVQSMGFKERERLSGECSAWSVKWEVWSVECKE